MLPLLFGALPVYATDPLTVIFESNPLFSEINFLPGDSVDGDVTVTNNTGTAQNIYIESVNGYDPDGLGSQLYLKVFENAGTVYQDELDDFLSAGPVPLSSLDAGTTATYTFEVSFINSEDNSYQGKTLGFDLCIGFSGGAFQCGDTVISPPSNPGGGPTIIPGGGGGGSGTSGQFVQLVIFGEIISSISAGDLDVANGTATIEWDTNLLATSQVIFGPVPPGGYVLNTNILPNLGYPLGTIENGTKVLHHTVVLNGLVGGQTYVYRVVSRASPPTVSVEHTFTMPTKALAENFGLTQTGTNGNALVGEDAKNNENAVETGTTSATSSRDIEAEDNNNLLAFALGGLDFGPFGLIWVGVALLIALYLLWKFMTRERK